MFAGKWANIALLALAEVLAMSLWFSGSAVVPALRAEFALSDTAASLMASAVSLGFVAGTLASALLTLADRVRPQRLFLVSALVAATANATMLAVDPTSLAMPALRFVVGVCTAGIYPVGMLMASSWTTGDRGLLVGLLVGALTLGSASPHLIGLFGGIDWRFTIWASSALAAAAGLVILAFRPGRPFGKAPPFRPAQMLEAWTIKPLRLANLGYFGHMIELYAVWAWIGVFLAASLAANPGGETAGPLAKSLAFLMIGSGAVGSILGGLFADRWGRTTLTMAAMATSGACCLLAGFLFAAPPLVLALFCVVWGIAIVADSAQFSASVIELSPPEYTGTMLTTQTSVGFMLTILTIHALPFLEATLGWQAAFAPLAIGPFLGVAAMARLRAHPEAAKLAGGRR